MQLSNDAFFSLVRLGIDHPATSLPQTINWQEIRELAERHGLYAVVLDSIDKLPSEQRPSQELLLEWIGKILQNYEYTYEQYCKAIAKLAGFYNCFGYKMMVIKGYACSLDWPKPEHRPCGDIDIWLFGKQKEADETLRQVQGPGFKIDKSHHHHTVFMWDDFTVENHYDFINVHDYRSSKGFESVFKEMGEDDSHSVKLLGENVYLPSPNLHALFLVRHLASHFAAAEITFRQILDWGFFVENHTKEVDWKWLEGLLDKYHMKDFFNSLNAICVEDFGFEAYIFPFIQFLPDLKNKILDDIMNPKFVAAEPQFLFPRLLYKYRRWQSNAWKQKLCYPESRVSGFLTNIWAHLLKPSSI